MPNTILFKAARLALLIATAAVLASPEPARAQIYLIDIVSGNLAETRDPTFTVGNSGPVRFNDIRENLAGWLDPFPTSQIDVFVVGSAAQAGRSFVNSVTGLVSTGGGAIQGGDFDGVNWRDITSQDMVGLRDDTVGQHALIGPSGITYYTNAGVFNNVFNPTLSSGDFDGMTFSEIPPDAYVGFRNAAGSQIALVGPSGIQSYDIVGGALAGTWNPMLSGGTPWDGMRFSDLSPDDFVGYRDAGGSQIALVPEPNTMLGSIAAMGALAFMSRRQQRRAA